MANETKLWVAYNHNGTALCKPTTKQLAQDEASVYSYVTGNGSYIDEVEHEPN